jgi:hypothetical protein
VSKMRHSLSDESVRAATVLGSWCSLAGAIPHEEIVASLRDKSKRPKGKEPGPAAVSSRASASNNDVVDSE